MRILFVKPPPGNGTNNAFAFKRIGDHLLSSETGASVKTADGEPVPEPDGTWQIQVPDTAQLFVVKGILIRHYGLEIVSERSS